MKYQQEIHNYLQEHKEEIISTLKFLVKIHSVRGEAEDNAPFGKECAEILKVIQNLYHKNGFETNLDEKGGYLLSYYGESEKSVGLFSHADVVYPGKDWICTSPFNPVEKDGFLIGRGVMDDKSAIVCSLFILKVFKEAGIPFDKKIVLKDGDRIEKFGDKYYLFRKIKE